MLTRWLVFLALSGLAVAEPHWFKTEKPLLGYVILIAEDGEAEAAAILRAGYHCAVSHARSLAELKVDEVWARQRAGWDIPTRKDDWTTTRNDFTVIGLGNRAPIAWRRDGGVVCIDPAPELAAYFDVMPGPFEMIGRIPSRCFWDPAYGRSCENSLYTGMPLVLGDAGHVPMDLGPNAHTTPGSLVEDDSPLQKEVRRWLAIHQPLPVLGFTGTRYRRSPNWAVRNLAAKVDTVIIRPSFTSSLDEAEERLIDDQGKRFSAHYVVDKDGQFVQMVDERWTAWPDGQQALTSLEDRSIVLQLVNRGDGEEGYTDMQRQVVARLSHDLRTRWAIPEDRVFEQVSFARRVSR